MVMTVGRVLNLPNALARRGLRVEVRDGWGSRGLEGLNARGSVAHWTAGPKFNGDYNARPSLNVVTYGRPDLANALCHVYGDRRGAAVVVASGLAWHAGDGYWNGLRYNSDVLGCEMEGAGPGDFTPEQLEAYPKILAAFGDITGNDPGIWSASHSEWAPTRKIDIGVYMPDIRAKASAIWRGAALPMEDDMYDATARNEVIGRLDLLSAAVLGSGGSEAMRVVLNDIRGTTQSSLNGIVALIGRDPSSVSAKEIAAALPDGLAQQVADELAKRLAS